MASRRLSTIIGEPHPTGTGDERALALLDSLRYGHNLGFACGPPSIRMPHWGHVHVLEAASDEAPPPLERLTSSLSGLATTFEVVIESAESGMMLLLGFESSTALERGRRILAPGCLMTPVSGPGTTYAHAVGVTHRPQGVAGNQVDLRKGSQLLLDKLDSLGEGWQIILRLQSTTLSDMLSTGSQVDALAHEAAGNLNVTERRTDNVTTTAVSHRWQRVQDWLGVISTLLSEGAGIGLWTVDTWTTAYDSATAHMVAGALHSSVPSDQGRWYETISYDNLSPGEHPPTSVLTSRDLGRLLASPRASQPGLAVRKAPPSGRRPGSGARRMKLGSYLGTSVDASISLEDLEGHGFVTGTTGSGKSTTLHTLLADLWNRHGVPFLVLDPVKDDYSHVAEHFRGGIQMVRGADLHLNIMEPWPHEDPRAHIAQVAAAFKGAFTMPSPTPYVVTQLFDRVSMFPSSGVGMSLFDVRDLVPQLISSLGYAPEQEANIRASLMTRLNLLLAPTRAHRFSWPDSSMVQKLFERPTVVTLGDLSDDEERSFVVLLLALATWAKARGRRNPRAVEHVLVLEEAHRILPEIDERADPEAGSAQQVSSALLSSMMAEVRSYGEQLLVVDQSPSRVSSDVSRNTNLKIAHRIVHPEDQREVVGMLGLPEDAAALLGELGRGHAICTTRTEPSAQSIAVDHVSLRPCSSHGTVAAVRPLEAAWPCPGSPETHFRAWRSANESARPMALFLGGILWGNGNGRRLREHVHRDLLIVADGDNTMVDCLAWGGLRQLTARRRASGPGEGLDSADSVLTGLYELWAERLPVTKDAATGIVTPQPGQSLLRGDGWMPWEEQSLATVLLDVEPRNGLRLLRNAAWRSELPDIEGYLKQRLEDLTPLLGDGAQDLLRVLVTAAVRGANLTPSVRQRLLSRAGLT